MFVKGQGREPLNVTETEIRYAMEHTRSCAEAARFLSLSYDTFKKYAKFYVDKVTGVKQPDYFWMEWELNTPSVDENGKGDHLPRVSFVIKACKMTIEDKIWDSNKVTDTMTLRTNKDRSLQLSILEMGEGKDVSK